MAESTQCYAMHASQSLPCSELLVGLYFLELPPHTFATSGLARVPESAPNDCEPQLLTYVA